MVKKLKSRSSSSSIRSTSNDSKGTVPIFNLESPPTTNTTIVQSEEEAKKQAELFGGILHPRPEDSLKIFQASIDAIKSGIVNVVSIMQPIVDSLPEPSMDKSGVQSLSLALGVSAQGQVAIIPAILSVSGAV